MMPSPAGRPIGEPALRRVVARGIVRRFGATVALRGVDVTLEAGKLTLIEGANGSGKTTLLRILGTMIRPSLGEVVYEPLGSEIESVRGQLGWVSHDTLAYGDLSGRQNIALAAELHGVDPSSAWRAASERFELGAFAERPMRTNSRGQRQRIALARALVHAPSLLLLDEPTTGLDRTGVDRLLAILEDELKAESVVAVVSHEPELFGARVAARVVLDRGRVRPPASVDA